MEYLRINDTRADMAKCHVIIYKNGGTFDSYGQLLQLNKWTFDCKIFKTCYKK